MKPRKAGDLISISSATTADSGGTETTRNTQQGGTEAAAARRRIGELAGGENGSALIHEADDTMTAESVRNPARMADVLLPGFL
jgi:hypothetical protein